MMNRALTYEEVVAAFGEKPFGCKEKQIRFALYMAQGHGQTESARMAGYAGNSVPQTAHNLKSKEHVRALIDAILKLMDGRQDEVLSADRILQIATNMAQTGNSAQKTWALKFLAEYHDINKKKGPTRDYTDAELLDQMCRVFLLRPPFGVCAAVMWAQQYGADWFPYPQDVRRIKEFPELVELLKRHGCNKYLVERPRAGERENNFPGVPQFSGNGNDSEGASTHLREVQ